LLRRARASLRVRSLARVFPNKFAPHIA